MKEHHHRQMSKFGNSAVRKSIGIVVPVVIFLSACFREQAVPVTVDFSVTVDDNDYSVPVRISLKNFSTGADRCHWTFDGGEPAASDNFQPATVTYHRAGTYVIRLEAWNDDERKVKDFSMSLDSAISIGFDAEIAVNAISPVRAFITNATRGAVSCLWTFDGGEPAVSESYAPPPVVFTQPGDHTIRLHVSNGREHATTEKTIQVLPPMSIGFSVEPSFDDLDMEAPWTGTLRNGTVSGLTYSWAATSGALAEPQAENTQWSIDTPGTYTITLEADNGKETQTSERTVTILPDSHLFTETNVRLGCTTAHASIGCFYSCSLRKTLTQRDMDASPSVDLVFFGIGPLFPYCRFVSPDADEPEIIVFDEIVGAGKTFVVNKQTVLTAGEFDAMTTDDPLLGIDIRSMDTGDESFAAQTPYVVLFETDAGRKGAIKIKGFIAEGNNSYILADIKMQKQ
ncbi:MAG: PKD domain-containing protein [Bacteroidales bacterium]|jgi:PKD repeat protein|nr:PKD domain-containing protein [Bacteroidales bacterium]